MIRGHHPQTNKRPTAAIRAETNLLQLENPEDNSYMQGSDDGQAQKR